MISLKQNAVLKNKIKSYESIRHAVNQILLHPLTLILFVSVPIYSTLLSPGELYADFSFLMRALIHAILMTINFTFIYLFMPRILRFGLTRNIPAFWLVATNFGFLIVFETFFINFVFLDGNWVVAFKYLCAVMLTVFAAVLIFCSLFRRNAEKTMANDPLYLPYWMPVRLDKIADSEDSPHKISSVVTHLIVEQNYTHIYTIEGDYLERGALSEMLQLIDADEGIRIHRSMWIRKDRIEALIYKNGNPKVKDIEGNLYPASRSSISDIKKCIKNNLVEF